MAMAWSRISSKVIAPPPYAEAACTRRCGNGKNRSGSLYRRWGTKESRRPGRAARRRATVRAAGAGDPRAASLPPARHDLAPWLRRPPRATGRAWLSDRDHDRLQKGDLGRSRRRNAAAHLLRLPPRPRTAQDAIHAPAVPWNRPEGIDAPPRPPGASAPAPAPDAWGCVANTATRVAPRIPANPCPATGAGGCAGSSPAQRRRSRWSGSLYRRWGTKESRRPGRASRRRATVRADGAGGQACGFLLSPICGITSPTDFANFHTVCCTPPRRREGGR